MKILVVTSETTYMPGNYHELLRALISLQENSSWQICGVASLKTFDLDLIKKLVGLPFLGVFDLPKQLALNALDIPLKKREKLCEGTNTPHKTFLSLNDPEAIAWVKEIGADLILNIRTRCIYKEDILNTPSLGCINIHHGLLPTHRGTFCDLYALSENRPAGFSIHKMEKKIDDGTIFAVVTVNEGTERNYMKYLSKTEAIEIQALKDLFDEIALKGALPEGIPNKPEKKIYTKNPTPKIIKDFKKKGMIL